MPETTLAYPYPVPSLTGVIKSRAEDFFVDEILGFTPAGKGEHLWLQVEKQGLSTHDLVQSLCRENGLKPRQVSYSGLKDKLAVTRQWLSIHLPGHQSIPELSHHPDIHILKSCWHERKLRIGTHKSNRFRIKIRQLQGDRASLDRTIKQVMQGGFASYFGEQRFGMQRNNVNQAITLFSASSRKKRINRHRRSLLLSSLRSELFNQVLNQRILQGIWHTPMEGDVFMLAGSHSIFSQSLDQAIAARYRDHDLDVALSLPGAGESRLQDKARVIEQAVLSNNQTLLRILVDQEVKWAYRSNRSRVNGLQWTFDGDNQLSLEVELARGVYLTSLLAQLGVFSEPGRRSTE